jgi:hypothetical protein
MPIGMYTILNGMFFFRHLVVLVLTQQTKTI